MPKDRGAEQGDVDGWRHSRQQGSSPGLASPIPPTSPPFKQSTPPEHSNPPAFTQTTWGRTTRDTKFSEMEASATCGTWMTGTLWFTRSWFPSYFEEFDKANVKVGGRTQPIEDRSHPLHRQRLGAPRMKTRRNSDAGESLCSRTWKQYPWCGGCLPTIHRRPTHRQSRCHSCHARTGSDVPRSANRVCPPRKFGGQPYQPQPCVSTATTSCKNDELQKLMMRQDADHSRDFSPASQTTVSRKLHSVQAS